MIETISTIFEPSRFAVRKYERLSSGKHTSYLIFEKDVLEQELGNDWENNCPSCLLHLLFFPYMQDAMNVQDFNEGKAITKYELREKMEQLAVQLHATRISIADCSYDILYSIHHVPYGLRLNKNALDTLCEGKTIWNEWGYKMQPQSNQQIMDDYNALMINAPLSVLLSPLYHFIDMNDHNNINNRTITLTTPADLEHSYVQEYWNKPVKEFFCEIRKMIAWKHGHPLSVAAILRILHDIVEHNLIMVVGEYDYMIKVIS